MNISRRHDLLCWGILMPLDSLWALRAERSQLQECLKEQAPLLTAPSRQVFKGQGKAWKEMHFDSYQLLFTLL